MQGFLLMTSAGERVRQSLDSVDMQGERIGRVSAQGRDGSCLWLFLQFTDSSVGKKVAAGSSVRGRVYVWSAVG